MKEGNDQEASAPREGAQSDFRSDHEFMSGMTQGVAHFFKVLLYEVAVN